jgi:hypothetical protein
VPSDTFLSLLEHSGEVAGGAFEPLDEEEDALPRKGRARTPSKKEKALLRALRKL